MDVQDVEVIYTLAPDIEQSRVAQDTQDRAEYPVQVMDATMVLNVEIAGHEQCSRENPDKWPLDR